MCLILSYLEMCLVLSVVMLQYLQIKAQLHVSSSDYDGLQQRCSECRATLKLLEQLLKVSDGFCSIQDLTASKSYEEATRIHAAVCDVLTDIHNAHGNSLLVFPCLVRKRAMLENDLETCVMSRWKELMSWSASPPALLTLVSGPAAHQELRQLSQSLHNLGSLSGVISKFAGQVMTNFVNRIFSDPKAPQYDLEVRQDSSSVTLKVVDPVTEKTDSGLTQTMHKLDMFTQMMELLYSNLLDISVTDEVSSKDDRSLARATRDAVSAAGEQDAFTSSKDAKSSRSLMSMFGEECGTACLEALIRNCLSSAIPSSQSARMQFSGVSAAVDDLQGKLVGYGFITEDDRLMVDYVKNVDVLFVNKRCVELLSDARNIIMSDIHNIVPVTSTCFYW